MFWKKKKKKWIVNESFTPKDSTEKNWGRHILHALEDLEPLYKIFYTFACKKVLGKIRQIYGKSKASSGEI